MIVQHGDVLGMRADKGAVEISIQMDGFGAGKSDSEYRVESND